MKGIMASTVMAPMPEAATCTKGMLRLSQRPMLDTPLDCPLTIVDTDMMGIADTVQDMPHTVLDTIPFLCHPF